MADAPLSRYKRRPAISPDTRSGGTARPFFRRGPRAATLALVERGLDLCRRGRGDELSALAARIRALGRPESLPPDERPQRLSILQAKVFAYLVEHGDRQPEVLFDLSEELRAAGWSGDEAGDVETFSVGAVSGEFPS